MNGNLKIFVAIALMLGLLVIGIEVGTTIFGLRKTDDSVTLSQITELPPDYDQDLIARVKDREKYLLLNKEQFLGSGEISPTPTPSITSTISATPN